MLRVLRMRVVTRCVCTPARNNTDLVNSRGSRPIIAFVSCPFIFVILWLFIIDPQHTASYARVFETEARISKIWVYQSHPTAKRSSAFPGGFLTNHWFRSVVVITADSDRFLDSNLPLTPVRLRARPLFVNGWHPLHLFSFFFFFFFVTLEGSINARLIPLINNEF